MKKAIPSEWNDILRGLHTENNSEYIPVMTLNNIVTSKEIYSKLVEKGTTNRGKLYWEEKFRLTEYDWENYFTNNLYSRLTPRKIHDFNFKFFYGVLPTESRLE